jgi:chorismate dehydratase
MANAHAAGIHSSALELSKPRLGQISFANCLPILLPLERQHVVLDAEVVLAPPSRLNQMFQDGQLELGSMSSFYFLCNDLFRLCPDLSISCRGPVGSVLFFAKSEPSAVARGKVVASAQSATSVNLLRVLFAEHFGSWPNIIADERPDLDSDEFDGALVIGDRALEVDTSWSQRYVRIDMGAWWWERYHLPMVFGVWAARCNWAEANPYRFAEISRGLRTAKMLGLTRRWKDTLFEANRRTGLSLSRLERYYKEELNFDFDADHHQGLSLYQSLLRKYNLIY